MEYYSVISVRLDRREIPKKMDLRGFRLLIRIFISGFTIFSIGNAERSGRHFEIATP